MVKAERARPSAMGWGIMNPNISDGDWVARKHVAKPHGTPVRALWLWIRDAMNSDLPRPGAD
jgi:hypothetical protein